MYVILDCGLVVGMAHQIFQIIINYSDLPPQRRSGVAEIISRIAMAPVGLDKSRFQSRHRPVISADCVRRVELPSRFRH